MVCVMCRRTICPVTPNRMVIATEVESMTLVSRDSLEKARLIASAPQDKFLMCSPGDTLCRTYSCAAPGESRSRRWRSTAIHLLLPSPRCGVPKSEDCRGARARETGAEHNRRQAHWK